LVKDPQEVSIPSTIQDVIMARVDSLPEGAKEVLQTGSAIEREFSYELIKQVTGLPEQELLSRLSALKDSELVYERGIYPQSSYIFKHALTRDVAYNSLLLKRRKEIHEKIAKAIEKADSERLEEFCEILAHHYSKTDNLEKTYQYLKLSAEKAARNFANWEAFRFFKEAIGALKKRPSTDENKREQLEIIDFAASALLPLAYPEGSLQFLQDGERIATELGDDATLTRLLAVIGFCYAFKLDPRCHEYIQRAFEAANKAQDVELLAATAVELCTSYHSRGEYQKILDMASRVVSLIEETNTKNNFFGKFFNPYAALCMYCGYGAAMLGNFKEGEALLEKALRYAIEINHAPTIGCVEGFYGEMFIWKGDGKNAIKHLEKAIRYFEDSQTFLILGLTWCLLGYGHYLLGRPKEAKGFIEKGIKMQLDAGNRVMLAMGYWYLGMVHFDLGDLESTQTCAEKALELSKSIDENHHRGLSWELLGRALGKSDPQQIEKAEEYILNGIRIHEEWQLKPLYPLGYFFLGELYADTGQRENALENLKKAEGMYQEMGMDYWLGKTQEVLGRL